jgi:CarD family transcriptional regulator, regulator of rRNA transcription
VVFSVGNKVVYPCQGPCLIDKVINRVVNDRPRSFYHLVVLDGSGGEVFVPVDKVQAIGIRPLLEKSDIPRLLDQLTKTARIVSDWRQRAGVNLKLFISGSAFDLARIIESLTELRETKELTLREKWTLERARKLLVSEISEVMGETKSAAEEQVDQALDQRKTAMLISLPLASHLT